MFKKFAVGYVSFLLTMSNGFAQINCGDGTYHCCKDLDKTHEPCGSICSDRDGNSQTGSACDKGTCTTTANGAKCSSSVRVTYGPSITNTVAYLDSTTGTSVSCNATTFKLSATNLNSSYNCFYLNKTIPHGQIFLIQAQ